ncbi:hypothetical protein AGMMS4957_02990 [Bacteroidia bacterium]|nr:hypothetical protein AGMMS4957_02990 [Bacteroidia bacterium]
MSAQTQYRSEWNFHAAGGITMRGDVGGGIGSIDGIGGNAGIRYAVFPSRYFGISVGAEAALHRSTLTLAEENTEELIATPPGLQGKFFLRTHYAEIEERLTEIFLQLPLMLHLQLPISKKHYFYLAAGAKYGIPLAATGKQTAGTATTTGYSDYTEVTFSDMPERGFTTEHNAHRTTKPLQQPIIIAPTVEAGFKWNNRLYTGFYMDMGYSAGVKIGIAVGAGRRMGDIKPPPLWGD